MNLDVYINGFRRLLLIKILAAFLLRIRNAALKTSGALFFMSLARAMVVCTSLRALWASPGSILFPEQGLAA